MVKARRRAALALLALLLPLLGGCAREERRSYSWYIYFDTVATLTMYGSSQDFEAARALTEATLERYHRACDIYHEYSGMNNARSVNLRAGEGPVTAPPELLEVLAFGREMHTLTRGRCNIAMGAVLSLWHEAREAALSGAEAQPPAEEALRAAAEHCDINDMLLDADALTVYLADPAMSLDLGAVAKGYAAEAAARALKEAGYSACALSLGGNVRLLGEKPGGEPWTAAIQDPIRAEESAYRLRLSLSDAALVTSGTYQRYFEAEGRRYHHIIDPETLYPREEFASVSILSGDSGQADALSTAVFNVPLREGLDYVNQLPGVEACWILADGKLAFSDGFPAYDIP